MIRSSNSFNRAALFLLCVGILLSSRANADIIVDVSNLGGSTTGLSPVNPLPPTGFVSGQSFTPTADNLAGVRLVISSGAASELNVELHEYSSLGTHPSPLASATVGGHGAGIAELLFASPVAVTPGNLYFIAFKGGVGDSGFFAGTTSNSYSDGSALTNPNFSSFTVFDGVGANPGPFDFSFETLTDNSFGVPEPSYTVFMIGLVFIRPKRKKETK